MKIALLAPAFVMTLGGCRGAVPIEELGEGYPRTMNPSDAEGRTIYKAADGSCFVHLPFEEPPRSAGVPHPRQPVECPPSMSHPSWSECTGDVIRASEDGADCVCDTAGNPPPPTVPRVECPESSKR